MVLENKSNNPKVIKLKQKPVVNVEKKEVKPAVKVRVKELHQKAKDVHKNYVVPRFKGLGSALKKLGKKNVGSSGYNKSYMPTFKKAGSAAKSTGVRAASGMGVYIVLLIIGLLSLFARNYFNYEPITSVIISIITAFAFLVAIHKTPEAGLKESVIVGAFVLDAFLSQGLLYLIPGGEYIADVFIAVHVFMWVGVAGILFVWGVIDNLGAGRKLSKMTYVVFIIFFIIIFPLIEPVYTSQKESHADYFDIAMETVEEVGLTLEKTANFWSDYFGCLGNFITAPDAKFEDCLEDKRIARFCKANFDTDQQAECKIAEKRKLAGDESYAYGAVSDIIKKVFKAKLTVPEGLFPKRPYERRRDYPIDLRIENERELEGVTGEASCFFNRRKVDIPGEISITGEEDNTFEILASGESAFRINCKPSTDLGLGTYKVKYKVTLSGLSTPSFIKRAFVNKDLSETEIKQIETDYFRSRDDRSSQAPKDLARMNFAFGKPHPTRSGELNPIIKSDEVIPFVTTFENVGRGKIVAVNSYSAETILERGFGIAKGESDCLEYGEVSMSIPVSRKSVHGSCDLELPSDLKSVEKYKIITFKLDFNYDYVLEEEESTTIVENPLEEETEEEPGANV